MKASEIIERIQREVASHGGKDLDVNVEMAGRWNRQAVQGVTTVLTDRGDVITITVTNA